MHAYARRRAVRTSDALARAWAYALCAGDAFGPGRPLAMDEKRVSGIEEAKRPKILEISRLVGVGSRLGERRLRGHDIRHCVPDSGLRSRGLKLLRRLIRSHAGGRTRRSGLRGVDTGLLACEDVLDKPPASRTRSRHKREAPSMVKSGRVSRCSPWDFGIDPAYL